MEDSCQDEGSWAGGSKAGGSQEGQQGVWYSYMGIKV